MQRVNMDINEIPYWPIAYQLIVVMIVTVLSVLGAYHFFLKDTYLEIQAAMDKEDANLRSLRSKALQAAELRSVKENVKQLEENYEELMLQLPGSDDLSAILASIDNVGVQSNLKINNMSWSEPSIERWYTMYPLNMQLEGEYNQVGIFSAGIADLSRVVSLNDFTLTRINMDNEQLRFQVNAAYYRFNEVGHEK
ncbi:hypothetical protein VST7929_02537 [Vibrio stylophorae]|uniref:Fimbrial protein n=2 Tax=Vibrio stylophorae TaxID=659351 RepID=A0ABM8ZX73_9VIBR|nr:hypothetical protein VST7929_02537 [Vibrio stylophorae]